MTVQFNGRRPLRKPGDKRTNNDLSLAEVSTQDDVTTESKEVIDAQENEKGSKVTNVRLTPAQTRQLRAESQQNTLVSYRGFSLKDGNVREEELMISPNDLLQNPFEAKMRSEIELKRAEETIEALSREMQKSGFEGSLRARKDPKQPGKYQLVYGHLRVEAAKRAGIKFIKVAVEELTDREMLNRMFNENTLRDDPGPVGDGETMQAIQDMEGLTVRELAERIGKSHQWVQDRLELAKMSERAKNIVRHNPKAYSLVLKLNRSKLSKESQAKYLEALEKGAKPALVSEALRQDVGAINSAAEINSAYSLTDDEYDSDLPPFQSSSFRTNGSKSAPKKSVNQVAKTSSTLQEQEIAILKLLKGIGDKLEQKPEIKFSEGFLEQAHAEIAHLSKLIDRARKHRSL